MRSGRVRIDRVYGHESAGGSATPAGPGVSLTFLRRLETAMSAISTMTPRNVPARGLSVRDRKSCRFRTGP